MRKLVILVILSILAITGIGWIGYNPTAEVLVKSETFSMDKAELLKNGYWVPNN